MSGAAPQRTHPVRSGFATASAAKERAVPRLLRVEDLTTDLSGTTGTLYVDGVVAGPNTQMTLTPADLGETTQNLLDRPQYGTDPDLQGW